MEKIKGIVKNVQVSDFGGASLPVGKTSFTDFDFAEGEYQGRKYKTLNGFSWSQLRQCGASQFIRFKQQGKDVSFEAQPFVLTIKSVSTEERTNAQGEKYQAKIFDASVKAL